jgi:hypothetical protein
MTLHFLRLGEKRGRFAGGKSPPFLPVNHTRQVIPNAVRDLPKSLHSFSQEKELKKLLFNK